MNDKLSRILSSFDKNQIQQINSFLNSAGGKNLKKHIETADRERLIREFQKLDPNDVKRAFSGITKEDLARIFNKK